MPAYLPNKGCLLPGHVAFGGGNNFIMMAVFIGDVRGMRHKNYVCIYRTLQDFRVNSFTLAFSRRKQSLQVLTAIGSAAA